MTVTINSCSAATTRDMRRSYPTYRPNGLTLYRPAARAAISTYRRLRDEGLRPALARRLVWTLTFQASLFGDRAGWTQGHVGVELVG